MRDLNTLNDAALLRRHSRLVAADLADRAKPPKVRHPVHAMCLAMSEVFHVDPVPIGATTDAQKQVMQQVRGAVDEACGIPADVWHTEAPTVAGKYQVRDATYGRNEPEFAIWSGKHWSGCASVPDYKHHCAPWMAPTAWEWLRLISADTPPIPDWRPGDQVPEGERKQGLWHWRITGDDYVEHAANGKNLAFSRNNEYRPAAPGVREGEAYDESKYGVAG